MNLSFSSGLPPIAQGTARKAANHWDMKRDKRSIEIGLDLGFSLIDTAENYGEGSAERLIGELVASKSFSRGTLKIATKFSPHHSTKQSIVHACEQSLHRLKTDYIDLYQVHWPSATPPLDDILDAFSDLQFSGKIRDWGVCNVTKKQILAIERLCGSGPPVVQNWYSLKNRGFETSIYPLLHKWNTAFLAYSPLKYVAHSMGPNDAENLQKITEETGLTPAQLGVGWVMRLPNTVPIIESTNEIHLRQVAKMLDTTLRPDTIEALHKAISGSASTVAISQVQLGPKHLGFGLNLNEPDGISKLGSLFSPDPFSLAQEVLSGEELEPLFVRKLSPALYELVEGELKYWAQLIAHGASGFIKAILIE